MHKSKIIASLLGLLLSGGLFAQVTLYTATQNAAGGEGSTPHPDYGTIYLDWNFGENVLVNTSTNGNLITTNGMLQPARDFKSTIDLTDIIVQLYPNPTSDFSWLDITLTNQLGSLRGQIYNMLGQLVEPNSFTISSTGRHKIDFSKLPAGVYVLWIRYSTPFSSDVRKQSFKVIKLN